MKRFAAAVALALVAGCSSPEPVAEIELALGDGFIESSASNFKPGPVEFRAENIGEFGHTFVITDQAGVAVAATSVVAPGESVSMTVDLEPGTFAITCRIVTQLEDGSIFDHFAQGMSTSIEG